VLWCRSEIEYLHRATREKEPGSIQHWLSLETRVTLADIVDTDLIQPKIVDAQGEDF
jgi:hypothetical protein